METATHWSGTVTLETAIRLEAMVLATALVALKSLLWLLLEMGSVPNDFDLLPDAFGDKRFPLDELSRVKEPDAKNKDSNEADDDDDDDEEDNDDEDSDDEDDSGDDDDDDDDDEGSSDDEGDTNGDGGTDDDDDDDDDSDEDDDEDDEEDDDEEEEQNFPVFKKTK